MNKQEKNLELVKLMGWYVYDFKYSIERGYRQDEHIVIFEGCDALLEPYQDLAQFGAILLKFPEAIVRINDSVDYHLWCEHPPTQENILDEVLRMNGVKI